MARNLRTLDEVQEIATFAKLDETDTVGLSQCLYFSDNLNPSGMKLMEVDNHLLDLLKAGQRLVIRGEKTDHAVLCTDNKTYDLKLAETTNALLLVPDGSVTTSNTIENNRSLKHQNVSGLIHTYFELKPTRPKLKKIYELLEDCEYEGSVEERTRESPAKLYSTAGLLEIVQASEDEIVRQLHKLQACNIDGYWRLLTFEYRSRVLTSILNLVEENSWHFSAVPLEEVLNTLDNLEPRCILKHVLECYSEYTMQSTGTELIVYSLNEDKICQHFAEELLRNSGKFNFKEFLAAWQQCVPEGMKTNTGQLKGIALIDQTCFPEVVFRYHVDDLPEDERERFNALFKMKEKWTLQEITPYIEELASEKLSLGALLQKHARASYGLNGVKLFNSKRPVK